MKFLFCAASCFTASSTMSVSPATGIKVLFISYCGLSCLSKDGQSQNNLRVSSCWCISSPDFSPIFL